MIIIWLVASLLGAIAGYFFATPVLAIITLFCTIIGVCLSLTAREVAKLIALMYWVTVAIGNVVMWGTWYGVTQQSFIQDFINTYILR